MRRATTFDKGETYLHLIYHSISNLLLDSQNYDDFSQLSKKTMLALEAVSYQSCIYCEIFQSNAVAVHAYCSNTVAENQGGKYCLVIF